MEKPKHNLLLADDDLDDCDFFKEALDELPFSAILTTVNDGVELMKLLTAKDSPLPDLLFLDLNMPLKNGFDCLEEIKIIDRLKHLPVIIFSTSLDMNVVNALYEKGANYYAQKPGEFSTLKKVILEAITVTTQTDFAQPSRDKFILQP